MTESIQRSFSGGELAPALHARADMVKYTTGLATCRNFQVQKHGGASNRAGTKFVVEVKDSAKEVALLDFQFNDEQTYILEFGDLYMRIIQSGSQINIAAPSAWVTITAYVAGDLAENSGVNYYCYLSHTSSASDEPGTGVNWEDYWHALTGTVYELPTPYLEAEVKSLKYVQSADVVTIVHQNHPPQQLKRYGATNWVLEPLLFEPNMARPTNLSVAAGAAGAETYRYRVTAIKDNSFEESLPAFEAGETISGATQADPVVITTSVNAYVDDDEVYIDGIVGMTELNGRYFTINQLTTTTFELVGEDGTGHTAYSSGGVSNRTTFTITSAAVPTTANPNVITWTGSSEALEYYVYRSLNGVYGYIGTAKGESFDDDNITSNVDETPPIYRNPFAEAGDYPSYVTYYQQRQLFANTANNPEKVWASRVADYNNFSIRSPLQDDDSISWVIAGREVNQIRNMFELDSLLVMTSGGEHLIRGDVDGVLRPDAINPKKQGGNGSSSIEPLAVSNVALYLQARGSVIRDLKIDSDKGYVGSDLTVFATHLFENHQIIDWDYSQIPNSTIWAAREDGELLGLTYLPEHEVWGWHRHDTDGYFEQVQVVPEGSVDTPYFVVRRTINGVTKRYIERLADRRVTDISIDAFFVDSGLTYDGRNTDVSRTMALTTGTGWTYQDDLTITCNVAYFVAGDVGNAIVLKLVDSDGEITDTLTCNITAFTSSTIVTVQATKDVPDGFQGSILSDWSLAVDEFINLAHLEGKMVNILADGNVEVQQTVTSGAITIQRPAEIAHVGLPIQSDFETLDIDSDKNGPLVAKEKMVTALTMQVEASRGIWAGPTSEDLFEYAQREYEDMGDPTELKTGHVYISIESEWNQNGRIFVRQDDPLPLTILSVVPEGAISD